MTGSSVLKSSSNHYHKHNYNSFIQTGIVIISSLHSLLGHYHIHESLSTDIGESESSHNHLPGLACVSGGRLLATDCDLCFLAPVPALWAGMWVDPAQAALLVIS